MNRFYAILMAVLALSIPLFAKAQTIPANTSQLVFNPIEVNLVRDCFPALNRNAIEQRVINYKVVNQAVFAPPPTGIRVGLKGGGTPSAPVPVTSITAHLRAYVYYPPGYNERSPNWGTLPVVAMFHGGGWSTGSAMMWNGPASYFAARGAVAIAFEYRMDKTYTGKTLDGSRNLITPVQAVADARSAIRWIRKFHTQLGVDQWKITSMGDSAGGHLALATALVGDRQVGALGSTSDETGTDAGLVSLPNAMALLYPVVSTVNQTTGTYLPEISPRGIVDAYLPTNTNANKPNPASLYMPPSLIIMGDADEQALTPPAVTKKFVDDINFAFIISQRQPCCSLSTYPGKKHAFLTNDTDAYQRALAEFDNFLVRMGYLTAADPSYPYIWITRDSTDQCRVASETAVNALALHYGLGRSYQKGDGSWAYDPGMAW